MISLALALRLRNAGLKWRPERGDWFLLPDRDMDEDRFVVSDMTIEVHEFPHGRVLGFNGTVEWALDSIEQGDAVWLPSEGQLRRLLAGTFLRLERAGEGLCVALAVSGREVRIEHEDADEAYGLALLHLITGDVSDGIDPVDTGHPVGG
jgi:hypothetical protein